MNTPDLAPKDGDFVAFLAELERRQLQQSGQPASHAAVSASISKGGAALARIPTAGAASVGDAAAFVKAVPIGLVVIGLVLVIAGTTFDGGIFVVLVGAFFLWQAARAFIRAARALASDKAQMLQQMTSVLATHAQGKKPNAK